MCSESERSKVHFAPPAPLLVLVVGDQGLWNFLQRAGYNINDACCGIFAHNYLSNGPAIFTKMM